LTGNRTTVAAGAGCRSWWPLAPAHSRRNTIMAKKSTARSAADVPPTKHYKVFLAPTKLAKLAHDTDSADEAEAFADEYNRLELAKRSTGLLAFFDRHGLIRPRRASRRQNGQHSKRSTVKKSPRKSRRRIA
jgi:hypothetical protein